ncbi:MAG: ATP phosphoribosyltransferase regulatory subunit [Clostridia bacterium]|nr:ATP phosphoribosyltransferase regulatory subunit [Clostridia bacterium]
MNKNLLEKGEELELALRELYRSNGYRPYKMSKFEPYDLYAQNRSFVSGAHILTFTDTNGQLMALKPDVTLSIIKNYRGGQQKTCYHENVYRDAGTSREFREIPQAGLECIGEIDQFTQIEVLTLAAESLRRIAGEAILDIASVQWVRGLLQISGVSADIEAELLKCVKEKNPHGMRAVCLAAGMEERLAEIWRRLALLYGPARQLIPQLEEMSLSDDMMAAARDMQWLCDFAAGQTGVQVNLDFSILQDLEYYNGLVFKGYVPGVHESILSGGRYDHLVQKLGKQAGAIGFAVYLDLLTQLPADGTALDADVLLLYGDGASPDEILRHAEALRGQGKTVRVQKTRDDGRYGEIQWVKGATEL